LLWCRQRLGWWRTVPDMPWEKFRFDLHQIKILICCFFMKYLIWHIFTYLTSRSDYVCTKSLKFIHLFIYTVHIYKSLWRKT
jgi:hypothetical protein